MPTLTLRNALPSDAARCFKIETSAYEGDVHNPAKKPVTGPHRRITCSSGRNAKTV